MATLLLVATVFFPRVQNGSNKGKLIHISAFLHGVSTIAFLVVGSIFIRSAIRSTPSPETLGWFILVGFVSWFLIPINSVILIVFGKREKIRALGLTGVVSLLSYSIFAVSFWYVWNFEVG